MDHNAPATSRQKNYAASLGIAFSDDITFGELGAKIDEARLAAKPSDKQLEFARNLGIAFDESTITAPELGKQLDAEVAKRSRAALKGNPVLKAGETIMYKGNPYRINFIGSRRKRWVADLRPCFKGCGRAVTVMILTIAEAQHVDVAVSQQQAR